MVKSGSYKKWRENLLANNTLLAVITFVEDLFYPQSQPPSLAIIVKKGIPHPHEQNVLWVKIWSDGFRKDEAKRVRSDKVEDQLSQIKNLVQTFLVNPHIEVPNILEFQKACPVDFDDPDFELVPEAYLDPKPPSQSERERGVEQMVRDYLAYLIRSPVKFSVQIAQRSEPQPIVHNLNFKEFEVTTQLVEPIKGFYHVSGELDSGDIPLISCATENMGVEGYFDIKDEIHANRLTVASDGTPLTTFYHCYSFAAKDNVIICNPRKKSRLSTLLFIALELNRMRWRFSYGRKCYSQKFEKIQVFLPVKDGTVDEEYIAQLFESCYGWEELERYMLSRPETEERASQTDLRT